MMPTPSMSAEGKGTTFEVYLPLVEERSIY